MNIRKEFFEKYARVLNASCSGDGFPYPHGGTEAQKFKVTVAVTKSYRYDLRYAMRSLSIFAETMKSYINRWIKYAKVLLGSA